MEIVAVDIGGTHARFSIAEVWNGRVQRLGEAVTLKSAEHASLQTAWQAFAAQLGRPVPSAAGIAIAAPVHNETIKLTNNPWTIRPGLIAEQLKLDAFTLVNDFGAVGHAVAQADATYFQHVCGPDAGLPDKGVISIVGPGTGLGVAQVLRRDGRYYVNETEGGHIDFAPLDAFEDSLLANLRQRHRRVSAERVVSGPGLADLYQMLAIIEGRAAIAPEDKALWAAALEATDSLAVAALDRFCLCLGAVAGDIALAQGGSAVVIAGGVGLRLKDHLPISGFAARFIAKGRFERMMSAVPVLLITHPQPGLFGAAAAFAEEYRQ